jgi:hypothetical protein
MDLPSPHGDKLKALLDNDKLPNSDHSRVEETVRKYNTWLSDMAKVEAQGTGAIDELVALLNDYKFHVDINLIFDSPHDFLYRQKGQLKLDNTVIEEFLPWVFTKAIPGVWKDRGLRLGPTNCFSHLRFDSTIRAPSTGGGMATRTKDQDFAISRELFLKVSHDSEFHDAVESQTHIAYVAAEIKTNLDKTMFQEAAATAYDLKLAVPNSRYYLLCEWLDMTPISTSVTAIEKVIVLRKAKRLASNVRKEFSSVKGREQARPDYVKYLRTHPYSSDAFGLLVREVEDMIGDGAEEDEVVLGRGWF